MSINDVKKHKEQYMRAKGSRPKRWGFPDGLRLSDEEEDLIRVSSCTAIWKNKNTKSLTSKILFKPNSKDSIDGIFKKDYALGGLCEDMNKNIVEGFCVVSMELLAKFLMDNYDTSLTLDTNLLSSVNIAPDGIINMDIFVKKALEDGLTRELTMEYGNGERGHVIKVSRIMYLAYWIIFGDDASIQRAIRTVGTYKITKEGRKFVTDTTLANFVQYLLMQFAGDTRAEIPSVGRHKPELESLSDTINFLNLIRRCKYIKFVNTETKDGKKVQGFQAHMLKGYNPEHKKWLHQIGFVKVVNLFDIEDKFKNLEIESKVV